MSRSITEGAWKIFREIRPLALARLCDRILAEAREEMERPGKSSHERYLDLFKLIQRRDDDVARGFNDFRRSTALRTIGVIHSMGLFTDAELRRFSPDTQRVIALHGEMPPVRQ